jgi:subtilase family serine protease
MIIIRGAIADITQINLSESTPTWSETTTYAFGDEVLHEGEITLDAGQSETLDLNFEIPAHTEGGNYYIILYIDPENYEEERNEDNNFRFI